MELSELKVIPKLQEDTHDDIDLTLTGDGTLHLRFDGGYIRIDIKNGAIVSMGA